MPKYINTFRRREYHEELIVSSDGRVVGTIRLKPSSLLWRPNGNRTFVSVPLERFASWIMDERTGASRTRR